MSSSAEAPRFGSNRYGPEIGSESYENTRRDFIPMNPPADILQLAPFVVPMPPEANITEVPVEMQWAEGAEVDPERKRVIEDFIGKFYRRATLQEVAGDIERVDVYQFVEPEHEDEQHGYKIAEHRYTLIEPVVSSEKQFENNFERAVFVRRLDVSFGDIRYRPHGLHASPTILDISVTPKVRAARFRIPATHLGTARRQPQEPNPEFAPIS